MFWRHVMLALSSADLVPEPVLDPESRVARRLQTDGEIFSSVHEPDVVLPLESREFLEGRIAARVHEQRRRLEPLADQPRDEGLKASARDALACDALIMKPERFQSWARAESAPAMPRPT